MLDEQLLEQTVEALLHATRIEFYGIGPSMPIALDAYYRFLRIGMPVAVTTDAAMQLSRHLPVTISPLFEDQRRYVASRPVPIT